MVEAAVCDNRQHYHVGFGFCLTTVGGLVFQDLKSAGLRQLQMRGNDDGS